MMCIKYQTNKCGTYQSCFRHIMIIVTHSRFQKFKTIRKQYVFETSSRPLIKYIKTALNTLAANYEYSRSNTENLPLPIEMQLSENPRTFCQFFITSFYYVFLKLLTPKGVLI